MRCIGLETTVFKGLTAILCLFAGLTLHATDYRPWYGPVLEVDLGADCLMQAFSHVNTQCGSKKLQEFDTFLDLSASLAVWESIAAELEVIAAETKQQSFGMDAIRLTGRYRWFNDIVGDPISLSTGVTFSTIFPAVRRNIAAFDHGGVAAEAHASIGKEWSCMQFWTSRIWGVCGVGIADVGSPWLRANFSWEHNWWNRHRLEIFTESIWGFGQNKLNPYHFHGYGSVQYQAIDLGFRYFYQFDYGVVVSGGYGYRVYAQNSPENVNLITLKLVYPF
ncbi:MAG: hypothetical protein WCG42_05815 [Parachlamydiaceae bacterium]